MRSFGKNPCTGGWNLKPRTPSSAISAARLATPRLPLCGSMLANGISMSALLARDRGDLLVRHARLRR